MAPPLAINKEQILDIFFGIWPTMVSSLSTATAYLSTTLNGSLSHKGFLQSWQPMKVITLHAEFYFVHNTVDWEYFAGSKVVRAKYSMSFNFVKLACVRNYFNPENNTQSFPVTYVW